MSFWDTVAGNNLATALENNLPIIAEALTKKQYTIECDGSVDAMIKVKEKIAAGDKFVGKIEAGVTTLLIMQEN
jgi:hypothetical protein